MHPLASDNRRFSLLGPVCLCLAPILIFYVLLGREMQAVPMYDDYHAILAFVLDLQTHHGFWNRLLEIAATQHDEYKLVVEHLITAGDYAATGHVHFGLLIALGNAMVLGIAGLLWANCFETEPGFRWRLVLFAPVLWLLFQLNYVENLDWAMCGLQTMPVLLFSLAALHFAIRSGRMAAVAASVSLLLACLSSANGFLVAPLVVAVLFRSRRFQAMLLALSSTVLALWIFLYRYQSFDVSKSFAKPSLLTKLLFFLSFLGGAVENMHHYPVANASVLLGALILAIMVTFWFVQRTGNAFVLATGTWCLLSAAVVAQGRSYLGVVMSLTGRYKIYSDLLLICCYILLASHFLQNQPGPKRRLIVGVILTGAVLFACAADVAGYKFLAKRRQRVMFGLRQYQLDPKKNSPEVSLGGEVFGGFEPEISREVLTRALRGRIYTMPDSLE